MTPEEFERLLHLYHDAGQSRADTMLLCQTRSDLLAAYRALWERAQETGPTSAVNEAETNALEQARRADAEANARVAPLAVNEPSARYGQ